MQPASAPQSQGTLPPEAREGLSRMLSRLPALRDELIPPTELLFDGTFSGDDYRKFGEADARMLIELGGLLPQHRVLDLGCGIGQKARPLAQYLSGAGSYEGLDIMPAQVAWCQENIQTRFPHFRFQRVNVYSKFYNPEGAVQASEYRFPFDDKEFDFAFLTSVFTHLVPADLERYLAELARVLKPGGRMFITYFLFDDKALRCMSGSDAEYNFANVYGSEICRVIDPDVPEAATAYQEQFIRGLYSKYGFEIVEPIHKGYWSGRDDYLSIVMPDERQLIPYLQDVVLAVKK